MKIFDELKQLSGIEKEEEEPREKFIHRMLLSIDLKTEEEFETLSEKAQKYFNEAVIAHNKQSPLPKLYDEELEKKKEKQTKVVDKKLGDKAIIRLLIDHNPKRKNSRSYGEFSLYKDGMTVEEYIKAGGSKAGIRWDLDKKYIRLE